MSKFNRVAFLFPGQGAQYPGMGRDFCDSFSQARELFEAADEQLGRNISSIIFDGPAEALTETQNSQVGIYLVSMALLKVVRSQFPDLQPSFVAGHSLGEYCALAASGRITFEQGLSLVQSRGSHMSAACKQNSGVMAAVIGLSGEAVSSALDGIEGVWVANFNCPGQVVISAVEGALEGTSEKLKAAGARRVLPLQVHGTFHSPLMLEAEQRLADEIESTPFSESEVGIAMNVTGRLEGGDVKEVLKKQVTSSVRWEESIQALVAEGVDLFVEIGCGKVLAGLNKRMKLTAPTLSIEKVEDLEKLAEALEKRVV